MVARERRAKGKGGRKEKAVSEITVKTAIQEWLNL
jgi:hypothetical protein